MLQQIKGNYIANAVKNNRNVIFTIRQAMTGGSINIAGNNIPIDGVIRDKLNAIVEYIENINSFILFLDTTNSTQPEEVIRKICAICTASHVFKAGTNKLINIKELFPSELNGLIIPNITVYSLKEIVGFQQYTGTFSQYLYALHLNPQLQGGGKDEKIKAEKVKKVKKNFKEIVEDRIIPSNKRANAAESRVGKPVNPKTVAQYEKEKMKFRKVVEISIEKEKQKYIDSYFLLILIICSIINLDETTWRLNVMTQFTLKYVTGIIDNGNDMMIHEEQIIQVFSSNIIEPIYYVLYRTFLYNGYGIFNFEYIKNYVTQYILGKISTIESTGSFSSLDSSSLDDDYIVYKNVIQASDKIANKTWQDPYDNILITALKKMITNIRFNFPEIGFLPANFSEGDSITRTFSQSYGGSIRKSNKSIHNKKLKNTHKINKKLNKKTHKGNKKHRRTYKKK